MGAETRLQPTDAEIAFFAGIWDRWEGVHKGEPVSFVSFAILTCEPNSLVAPLHDRMPAILQPEDYGKRCCVALDVRLDECHDASA